MSSLNSPKKSSTVRESMLQLMENAGVAYEEDGYDGVYEDADKSDAESLPSVPSSSNLSGYFHEELPPGYMVKHGEVVNALATAALAASSPSSVAYVNKSTTGMNVSADHIDELHSLTEETGEYSLDATSTSSSNKENELASNTDDLEGKRTARLHALAEKGTTGVSSPAVSKSTSIAKTPNSIRVNSKLSKEMYKDAIKAATRGSLRRLLDAENRQQQGDEDLIKHQQSPPTSIFTIVPKHKSVSRDMVLNDVSSDFGSEVASSITDTFAFSSVYGDGEDHQNMMTKSMPSTEQISCASRSQYENKGKKQVDSSMGNYPWGTSSSHRQTQHHDYQQNDDQNSTICAFDPPSRPVPPINTNGQFDFEEGLSVSQVSYGWSEPFAIKDEKDIVDNTENDSINLKQPRYGQSAPCVNNGNTPHKEDDYQSNTDATDRAAKMNISDDFSDEYIINKGKNDDEFNGIFYSSSDDVAKAKSLKEKVLYYKYQPKKRSIIIGCICIVAILGVIVGVLLSIQNRDTRKDDPIRTKGGQQNGEANGQLPITTMVEPTVASTAPKMTMTPSSPSSFPTIHPTASLDTTSPTTIPTFSPTDNRRSSPARNTPTSSPTSSSEEVPTSLPALSPITPTPTKTFMQFNPTGTPTYLPSTRPSSSSTMPSFQPTSVPTFLQSEVPSSKKSSTPSDSKSFQPSMVPSNKPSRVPSNTPTLTPTFVPTRQPTDRPSKLPSEIPSKIPSMKPSIIPSESPTFSPTTSHPTASPSFSPTNAPSNSPTTSITPSSSPTTAAELQRREDMTTAAAGISGSSAIADTTTPQYKALEWMIHDDGLQLDATSPDFVQRYSISTFYFATSESVWTQCGADALQSLCPDESARFLSANNVCQWHGIACNGNDEITDINLKNNGLAGTSLPTELKTLSSSLTLLRLSNNAIGSTIPSEIGLLSNLKNLYLNDNNFVGTIPVSVGNLNKLFLFSIGDNNMNGTLPSELFHPTLQKLDIDNNDFHGTLPSEMFTSSSGLTLVDMGGNAFEGTIPKDFGNLTSLTLLQINENNFEGPLPPELFASNRLVRFNCSSNSLNGSLPDELFDSTKLQELDVSSNEFTGVISTKIGNLDDLGVLKLQSNKFEGAIPSVMGDLNELMKVDVSYNLLTGSMPAGVCTSRDIRVAFSELISDCGGSIPEVTCDCCSSCEIG